MLGTVNDTRTPRRQGSLISGRCIWTQVSTPNESQTERCYAVTCGDVVHCTTSRDVWIYCVDPAPQTFTLVNWNSRRNAMPSSIDRLYDADDRTADLWME